jgi:uncharacterized protein YjbJ (UPF0337 family)
MNWDQIKGNWAQITGKMKQKWGKLTDNELTVIAGEREQLVGVLQERYGYAKEIAEKEVRDFTDGMKP